MKQSPVKSCKNGLSASQQDGQDEKHTINNMIYKIKKLKIEKLPVSVSRQRTGTVLRQIYTIHEKHYPFLDILFRMSVYREVFFI